MSTPIAVSSDHEQIEHAVELVRNEFHEHRQARQRGELIQSLHDRHDLPKWAIRKAVWRLVSEGALYFVAETGDVAAPNGD